MYLCLCFKTMMKMLCSSCVRLQIPLAMHSSFLFPQSIWPEMISKNDLIFLSEPWLSPYHRNVSKTEHDVVSEQFVQFVNNIWQFCSPSASPLTDPPLLPMCKCRLPMIRKLGKLYLYYWDWGRYWCVCCRCFYRSNIPQHHNFLYCFSLERITK